MLAPETAWEALVPWLVVLPPRRLPLALASGRALAAPLAATADVPFADVSAMDGYALGGEIARDAVLPVASTIAAGAPPGARLARGSALRIMTGAVLPAGADRVAPIEHTDGGTERVLVREAPTAGAHVRRQGEVLRRGARLLDSGALLTPGALGLLASHGHLEVPVHAPPRVAVLVTGDEVVPPEREPAPGQLRDSHASFLAAAVTARGGELLPLGIARDDPATLRDALARGLDADLLLATGGVSKGAYDFVEDALAELGFRPLFDGVAIQPGGPLFAAVREASPRPQLAFGLPGNPASVMVAFWLFVDPVLRRLQGLAGGFWHGALDATLGAPLPAAGARDRFLPATLDIAGGGLVATPIAPRGSHDTSAYARGTALVRVRAGAGAQPASTLCSALPLFATWG